MDKAIKRNLEIQDELLEILMDRRIEICGDRAEDIREFFDTMMKRYDARDRLVAEFAPKRKSLKIIGEFLGRSGFCDWWGEVPDGGKDEIIDEITEIVREG